MAWRTITLVAAMLVLVFIPSVTRAAPRRGFEALATSVPSRNQLTLAPGEKKEVKLTFQNIGDKEWRNDGKGYVSLYTAEPSYRKSKFDPGTWLAPAQVKRIREASVPIGEEATVAFALSAPEEIGTYKEVFQLAAEDITWIPGGKVILVITVEDAKEEEIGAADESGQDVDAETLGASGYTAEVVVRSADRVVTKGGRSILYSVGVKNTGTKKWQRRAVEISPSSVSVVHPSWTSATRAAVQNEGVVPPGAVDVASFAFLAPQMAGEYFVSFRYLADDQEIIGGEISIPVEVTTDSGQVVSSPVHDGVLDRMDKITEPTIRVGMLLVDEETQNKIVLRCDCETLAITDEAGNPLGAVGRTGEVVALYKDGGYFFDAGAGLLSSAVPLRFVPSEPNAPITIANFDRRATRGTEFADNQFRHTLELRYNAKKDRVWVINELPIEMYLRGLAETSNASPLEYQKAIATAARSYAYYQWSRKTKYFQEGFTVDAYRDQVYKGYGSETRMPQFVAAVEATRGVVVTYDGQVALTTYFASSDGRTRSWSEVWRGAMPYLLSVPAVCDEGKGLRGHGVGMSATGAACQARQGLGWKGIMKSYYTGVDFRREW